jgi:hypothetical protein
MSRYFWLGEEANAYEADRDMERALLEPYCDGEFTDSEEIEADGFITVHCSGPIRPIQD